MQTIMHLLSSLTIVTVALFKSPGAICLGKERSLITRKNVSLFNSIIISFLIKIIIVAVVTPAGKVIPYGPEK